MSDLYLIEFETSDDDFKTITTTQEWWTVEKSLTFFDVVDEVKKQIVGLGHCKKLVKVSYIVPIVEHISKTGGE